MATLSALSRPTLKTLEQMGLQDLARRRLPVWSVKEPLHGVPPGRHREVVHRLQAEGYLDRIERGVYRVVPLTGVRAIAPAQLVGAWFKDEPNAIIGAAAAELQRLILDVPTVIDVQLSRVKTERIQYQGITYRFTKARRAAVSADNTVANEGGVTVNIASPAKLMVLLLSQPSRGFSSHRDVHLAYQVFTQGLERQLWTKVNWPLMVMRHGNHAVARRLGFLLERHGVEGAGQLLRLVGSGELTNFSSAYPPVGPVSARWRLRLNDPILQPLLGKRS